MVNETTSRSLRDVVADKVNAKWNEWAAAHPQLARVVDRTRLIESTVVQLRQEPAFLDAMRQADLDEDKLAAAAKLLDQAERLVGLVMKI